VGKKLRQLTPSVFKANYDTRSPFNLFTILSSIGTKSSLKLVKEAAKLKISVKNIEKYREGVRTEK
jgi:hypothetical protein